MPRRSNATIEHDWYGCFAKWPKSDRAAALKILAVLHEQLPDEPRKAKPDQISLLESGAAK